MRNLRGESRNEVKLRLPWDLKLLDEAGVWYRPDSVTASRTFEFELVGRPEVDRAASGKHEMFYFKERFEDCKSW